MENENGQLSDGGDGSSNHAFVRIKESSGRFRSTVLPEFFMRHPSEVFSTDSLLERVWPADAEVSPSLVKTYIAKLRSKLDLEGEESIIRTVHGLGYLMASKYQAETRH